MKVRVRINITEPLKRGLRVAVDEQGNEVSLLFQYEYLPDFCYDCGIIGHKALDCPLKDFAGDNPKFDSGRFGSWLCAPSSPPRDRFRGHRQRESSPSHRPIMTMGEASRIVLAVERNRVRYSGPTSEELAPTSVLEAREREEVDKEVSGSKGPVVLPGTVRVEVLSKASSTIDGSAVLDNDLPVGVSGMHVSSGEGSKDGDKASSMINVEVDIIDEVIGHSKEKLTKEQKGKGVLDHSSQDEISFRHALQQTFDPIIKAQKAKTWKRLSSASGRGSKGGSKLSSFPISPKLSHVMVANAKYKCADRLGAWNKGKFGSIPRLVRETQKQLDDLLSVAAPLVRMEEVKRLETKLNDLLSREECYWKLRSRADWLAMGDRNTKYFHNKATGRKKKNAIVEIMTDDGRKLSVEEDIVGEIERYFGTIFSSASPTVQQTESPEHALVYCSSLCPLWSKLRLWKVLNRGRCGSLSELLVYLFEVLERNEFALLAMVWWWVWYDRNSVLFGKKQSRLEVIDVLAREAWEEFCGVSYGGGGLGASFGGVGGRGGGGGGDGTGVDGRGCGEPRGFLKVAAQYQVVAGGAWFDTLQMYSLRELLELGYRKSAENLSH
ncbi:hypothetical protein G4B88_016780 [Cannabis sativa]|uniref:CCHC-type domain-containing protein n=1 Tax=Cannabis sativa TaxID=3483 RepID=A0A7J6F900_CANSA|nr:hypothetical protein G4B88_016780 [Cannabis sativa]